MKWDQKTKRGKPKNEKVFLGLCRVLGPIREFLAHHEYDAKNCLAIGKGEFIGQKSIRNSDGCSANYFFIEFTKQKLWYKKFLEEFLFI